MQNEFGLDQDGIAVIKSFDKGSAPEGLIILEVNNPIIYIVASRIGFCLDGQLEFYTPYTPINPEYLKVQATYVAWLSMHLNTTVKILIKAVNEQIRDQAHRIVNEIFSHFGGIGDIQHGSFNMETGALSLGEKEFFEVESNGPPRVDIIFTPYKSAEPTKEEVEMLSEIDSIVRKFKWENEN